MPVILSSFFRYLIDLKALLIYVDMDWLSPVQYRSPLISCIAPPQITLISKLEPQKLKELNVKMQNDTFKLVFRVMDTTYTTYT